MFSGVKAITRIHRESGELRTFGIDGIPAKRGELTIQPPPPRRSHHGCLGIFKKGLLFSSCEPSSWSYRNLILTMLRLALLAGIGLAKGVLGVNLIASHFSGGIYTLSLTTTGTSGTISVTSQTNGCGTTPGWIELYSDTRKLYCFDESWTGRGQHAEFNVQNDGRLSLASSLQVSGNSVHGILYGGPDGRSYIATAE